MVIDFTTAACMCCGLTSVLQLDEEALIAWHYGAPIQEVFPDLSPEDRELVMTGTHGACFDALFDDENLY